MLRVRLERRVLRVLQVLKARQVLTELREQLARLVLRVPPELREPLALLDRKASLVIKVWLVLRVLPVQPELLARKVK